MRITLLHPTVAAFVLLLPAVAPATDTGIGRDPAPTPGAGIGRGPAPTPGAGIGRGPAPAHGVEIERSPADTRDYRALMLDNGLEALVVSDPDTDKAAAALDVNSPNLSSHWRL